MKKNSDKFTQPIAFRSVESPKADKPFQRIGSISNSKVGKDFEDVAKAFFSGKGLVLNAGIKIPIGIEAIKKDHAFDLGCHRKQVIVECKSHKWTAGGNVPSAKLTVWNEAMYYFSAAPSGFRKIMFVLRDMSDKRNETLAEYYIRTYRHMIPADVEFWEYDEKTGKAVKLKL